MPVAALPLEGDPEAPIDCSLFTNWLTILTLFCMVSWARGSIYTFSFISAEE